MILSNRSDQLCQLAALRTAVDLDVFKHVVSKDDSAKDVSQLAEATSCSPVLMGKYISEVNVVTIMVVDYGDSRTSDEHHWFDWVRT